MDTLTMKRIIIFLTFTVIFGSLSGCSLNQVLNQKNTPETGSTPQMHATAVATTTTVKLTLPPAVLLDIPSQSQLPELANGCEVTSLSMLLTSVHHPVHKMWLAAHQPTDPTPMQLDAKSSITFWGNPNVGFVGSVKKVDEGYGIYHKPLAKFLNDLLPGQASDLTGDAFENILASVARGVPVVLWTTGTFKPTSWWVTWNSPTGLVHATPEEHAVLLVGYNPTQLFINNPLNGQPAQSVNRALFIGAWNQLGKQALTVRIPDGS